jgi:hypothetical protein
MTHHEELEELRYHWGGAYVITCPAPDLWLAQRRDNRATLRAGSAGELRDMIEDDYATKPVPREIAPE